MLKLTKLIAASALLGMGMVGQAQASITFSFTESGGTVFMNSSGVLDTSKLVSLVPSAPSGWGGVGIETNSVPESDIMGDTTMGGVDTFFGFNVGTDLSPWVGNMFTQNVFSWTSSGTTQFATYFRNPDRMPGIGISLQDLVGALWTPDISWSKAGTLAGFGMTVGDYTITDARTGEYISIKIGQAVPEPASIALIGLGLAGLGFARRQRKA